MASFLTKLRKCECMGATKDSTKPAEGLKLKTVDCDWMHEQNKLLHRTDEYASSRLVLRRGQNFKLKMKFQRKLNAEHDQTVLEFLMGPDPQLVSNSKIRCGRVEELDAAKWGMRCVEEQDDEEDGSSTVTFDVNIPATALVGRYKVAVEFKSALKDGQTVTSRDPEPDVIVLFNPWCEEDVVYMADKDEREEYCMSDVGIIYRGSSRWISAKKWNFGQFEENVLECALSLLEKDKRARAEPAKWVGKRSDPVWVSRIVSAMVNAPDDNGILVGNWSGDYSGGVTPTKWNGSVEIIQQYHATGKPVSYGQCWVFSGVVTTVLRSLGIPTRSVTNFSSAHDTEGSMTIDKYVDESGEEIDGLTGDSVWNFHVWNECWMERKDLPAGYGGWQAVDATPQEVSLGLYQTGPAPLTAVRNGEVYLGFETGFVYAEVNADRLTWIVRKDPADGAYAVESLGSQYRKSVGKFISTKAVGRDERLDVTDLYKHAEGSDAERRAFERAYAFGSALDFHKGHLQLFEEGKGVTVDFNTTPAPELLKNGDGFSLTVTVRNDDSDDKSVDVAVVVYSTLYTGEKKFFVKRERFSALPLEGSGAVSRDVAVLFSDYDGKLVDVKSMRATVVVKVRDTGKMFADSFEFGLQNKDSVEVKLDASPLKVGETHNVLVRFTNPLPIRLTNVVVTVEGPGLALPVSKRVSRPMIAGGTIQLAFPIQPRKAGSRVILVDIDCKQVKDMKNFLQVDVVPA